MSWRVVIRPKAEADLREAQLWYNSQRRGLGDEFLDEVEATIRVLEQAPENRPPYYKVLQRFSSCAYEEIPV